MPSTRFELAEFKNCSAALFTLLITACSGGTVSSPATGSNAVTQRPSNPITLAYLRDTDGAAGQLFGRVQIEAPEAKPSDTARAEFVEVYWADEQGKAVGEPWLVSEASAVYDLEIPAGTRVPANTSALKLYPGNSVGLAEEGTLVRFHDFTGNALLAGPGGNEVQSWYYGDDRPNMYVQRTDDYGGLCLFDNGLVSVIDMNNTRDDAWEANAGSGLANTVSDSAYPPYQFLCDTNPVNTYRAVEDEYGVWTYSTLNDSLFYGTLVYDTFLKYLGEPALEEKLRLRVHYGNLTDTSVYWDGAYANFSDGYLFQYSMSPLDAIAHEVGHGVLSRISSLNPYENELSTDARTVHEAFGDISGVMAKYEFTGHTNNWVHGEEAGGLTRQLDQIQTEAGAIPSVLDYDEAGNNFYLRIGMLTYPFYLLANELGLEAAYNLYVNAARNCWSPATTLTDAAECIMQQAIDAGLDEKPVVDAFKTVKIQLFDEGVLSHFYAETFKLRVEFSDDSRSTGDVTGWLWDFGDGQTSTAANPEHVYVAGGDYQVSLRVTDTHGDQDSFARQITVSDQYCAIREVVTAANVMNSVSIGGEDLEYQPTEWDYTQTPIFLSEPANTVITVQGDNVATERSTTWRVWIDLNDNGVYGDSDQELLADLTVEQGQPYAMTTSLDLTGIANDGSAKYLRIVGDYVNISPCSASVGEALDVRVQW